MRLVLATTAAIDGGVWRNVRDLAIGFRALDIDVVVASPPGQLELLSKSDELAWASLADAVTLPADVWHLHVHDTYSREALRAVAVRRLRRGALIMTEHLPRTDASDWAIPEERSRGAWLGKTSFKRVQARLVDRIITVSGPSRAFMLARYGIDPNKISVVHYGVAAPLIPAAVRDRTVLQVLVAASLIHQKGLDVLIKAAERSAHPWRVRVVGEGPHREMYEGMATKLAPGRFEFVGWSNDVANELLSCDIACLPSRWESLPYAILEAMSVGRVCVATTVDGFVEMIDSGRTGVLVPPDDPTRLAGAIDGLSDTRRREVLGSAGRQRIATWFTVDRMIRGTMAVYEGAGASNS